MSSRPLFPVLRAGAVLVTASAILVSNAPLRQEAADPQRPAPDEAWTDTRWVDGLHEGAKMTGPRGPQQKKPPCLPRTERELFGACWALHGEKPPCPDGTFEANGSCFMPVVAPVRAPTSVTPGSTLP